MRPRKELGHGMREVSQRLLLHHLATVTEPVIVRAGLRKLSGLLQVTWCGFLARTPPCVLLYREVPHIPGVSAMPQQELLLLARWLKTEPAHANIVMGTI